LIIFVFLLLGFLNFYIRNLPEPPIIIPKSGAVTLIGQVHDEPSVKKEYSFFTIKANGHLISVFSKQADLEYGDRVKVSGFLEEIDDISNPGLYSFGDYLNKQGVFYRLKATRAPPELLKRGGGSFFKKISIAVREKLITVPQKTLPQKYAALFLSMVFGFKTIPIAPEVAENYKAAGVAHLLVASGMQLSILVGVCLFTVKMARLPLWFGALFTTIINVFYSLMAGCGPSILRAAIMAEIVLLGLMFEREGEIYTSLALSVFVILLYDPRFLFDIGFQLSYGATWSLIYVAPVFTGKFKKWLPKWLATLLAAALAPVLVSTPITLYHFNQASLIGVITNMLLLPWASIIVILGFVSTVLGLIFLPLAELINGSVLILLWLTDLIVTVSAKLPFAQTFLPPPTMPLVIGYYLGLIGLVEILRRKKLPKLNNFRLLLVACLLVSLLVWNAAFSEGFSGLTVTVLDVGQGDSILVETPSGKKMLVDAGEPEMGERVVVPYLRRHGISQLDLVVATHQHDDHIGGLPVVFKNIKVEQVLEPRAGQIIDFGQGCVAKILHPELPFLENINDTSVVMRLAYGNFSMMLTGDNEEEGEQQILAGFSATNLNSQVIKVGHHGSGTSTSNEFLDAVAPKIAVISCGLRNKFRHPHGVTLRKLEERGIKVYRTDRDGAVTIKSNGYSFSVQKASTFSLISGVR